MPAASDTQATAEKQSYLSARQDSPTHSENSMHKAQSKSAPKRQSGFWLLANSIPHLSSMLKAIVVAGLFGTVDGSFDLVRCCVKAARDNRIRLDQYPWITCSFNESIVYPTESRLPSITKTRGWCKSECVGHQRSDLSQWLQPIATWITPYIGLLLLCPVGEIEDAGDDHGDSAIRPRGLLNLQRFRQFGNKALHWLRIVLWEYVLLLGDPASALWGSFSEIWSDCRMVRKLSNTTTSWFSSKALWITILAGDTEFQNDRLWKGLIESMENILSGDDTTHSFGNSKQKLQTLQELSPTQPHDFSSWAQLAELINEVGQASSPNEKSTSGVTADPDTIGEIRGGVTSSERAVTSHGTAVPSTQLSMVEDLSRAISILVDARIDFFKGIFLPVALMLAVTASVFFEAYGKLGDKDTAHALAYGVWYSWLITLSVSGNCFATSVNVGMVQKTLRPYLLLSPVRVSLSKRYVNGSYWEEWLWHMETAGPGERRYREAPKRGARFWITFLLGQMGGWACVAFACACAAAISYTTPTVGLGCRSFSHVLYGVGAFVVAIVHVLCEWLTIKSCVDPRWTKWSTLSIFSYYLLVIFNALVMVLGTIFHLAGLYRSCWCSRLFAPDDTLLEMNRNTEQAFSNAKRYWLSIGYVAFSFVWVLCGIMVACRKFITLRMELAIQD